MPKISMDALCGGALLERFRLAMAQIGRNIMDPNTNPEKVRTITIKLSIKSDKARKSLKTSIQTSVTLAPPDADREREVLFETNAEVSEFQFDKWYDQENFMIGIQANFQPTPDLEMVMKLAGNVERKNDQTFSDDGRTQVATMQVGIASKADVIVPNPVRLVPYRTFQEVEQPASEFVFRMGDKEVPAFKIIEAEGGIWKNEAVKNIKSYLEGMLGDMAEFITSSVTIIG